MFDICSCAYAYKIVHAIMHATSEAANVQFLPQSSSAHTHEKVLLQRHLDQRTEACRVTASHATSET